MPNRSAPPRTGGGQKLELDSLILEYKNSFDRSNKLDNKVYIVITFCGFLFVFITDLFSGLTRISRPETPLQLALTVLYAGSCLAVMVAYAGILLFFLELLRPEQIHRMDPEETRRHHLARMTEAQAAEHLIWLYRRTVNENLGKLHDRCNRFTRGLRYVVGTVALAFLAYTAQILLLMV